MLSQQMDNSLNYHAPSEAQIYDIAVLRKAQKVYAEVLENLCPLSRELSIAKTEFENSCMWAIKAIVIATPKG